MVKKNDTRHTESLGHLLRQQREKSNIELKTVNEQTKIPLKTLEAMEEDDYEALPAKVFAHGFYTIYAKFLGLDSAYIVEQYKLHDKLSGKAVKQTPVPTKLHSQIKSMAVQPSIGLGTVLGFILVILVITATLVSLSLDLNPASYLSKKIRSNDQGLNQEQRKIETEKEENLYHVQAYFPSITKITVTQDSGEPENFLFQKGDTRSWMAKKNIAFILPEDTKVRLTVNGLILPLPEPQYGVVTVKIPEPQTGNILP